MHLRRPGFNNNIISNFRFYSATNLAKISSETVEIAETKSSNENKNEKGASQLPSQSTLHIIFNSKYIKNSTNQVMTFTRGPLRTSLLITAELVKLIASEQKLLPDWSKWPEAKAAYFEFWRRLRTAWLARGFSLEALRNWADQLTWAHAGQFLRVSAEMAAFYYIGQAFGYILSIPFK